MRRIAIATALVAVFTLPALAALPPQYQRQRELEAIIASPEVVDAFGFEGITSIEYVDTDLYLVKAGPCSLEVRIIDTPSVHGEGWAGPREFSIAVGEAVCG